MADRRRDGFVGLVAGLVVANDADADDGRVSRPTGPVGR
jgi:hypothetical protein